LSFSSFDNSKNGREINYVFDFYLVLYAFDGDEFIKSVLCLYDLGE